MDFEAITAKQKTAQRLIDEICEDIRNTPRTESELKHMKEVLESVASELRTTSNILWRLTAN